MFNFEAFDFDWDCEYCNETVHHEYDMVLISDSVASFEKPDKTMVKLDDMCYHVWCYERIQEDDH